MKAFALIFMLSLPLSAQVVVQTIDAPDTNISGLAFGAGWMWAVDGVTNNLYRLNSIDGSVLGTWNLALSGYHPTGLGFANNQIYVALTSGYVNIYSTSGAYVTQFSALC
jgi:hypothetical protein